jgi:hypothetical protein
MDSRRSRAATAPSLAFLAGAATLLVAMAVCAARVASREWFTGDDFAFLARVQRADLWSWSGAFLPLHERFWPFYRPLGMEGFFRLGFQAFGLHATGFFAVALVFHFARGLVVARLARQLGCGARAAVAAGLLAIAGPASLGELFVASIFHYVAVGLLAALCVSWFLDRLRGGGRLAGAGSWLAFAAALLCNESAIVIPALLALVALLEAPGTGGRRFAVAARRVAAHVAIALAYLWWRFGLIARVEGHALYSPSLGLHMVRNLAAELAIACGGAAGLALLCALAAAGAFAARGAWSHRSDLARSALLALAWIALASLPFVALPFPQPRFAIVLETPLALLAALALDALTRVWRERPRWLLDAACLLPVLLVFPWSALAEHARHPAGDLPRRLIAYLEPRAADAGRPERVVVLYGVEGLADRERGRRFRALAYNGSAVYAVWPDRPLWIRFHDLNERVPRAVLQPDARFVALLPDLTLAPADAQLLARELPRALGPSADGRPRAGGT